MGSPSLISDILETDRETEQREEGRGAVEEDQDQFQGL